MASLLAASGKAGELPRDGEAYRSTLPLLGKPIPLPPGEWTVVGQGYGSVAGPSPGAYGAIGGVMLIQVRGGIVEGLVLAHANTLPVASGWGPASECLNVDALYATGVRTQARNLSCAYVEVSPASGPTLTMMPAWAAGHAEIIRRGWALPGALAVAGARVGDRRDVVDVRYAWAAEQPARRMPVHRASTAEPPMLRLRARMLAPWIVRAMQEIEDRIYDPLGPTADLPWPGSVAQGAEAPAGASRWQRRLAQAASSRIVQASLAMGAGMVVTGSAYVAGILTVWQGVADGVGEHLVDMGWDWEVARPPMDFVAGVALPAG